VDDKFEGRGVMSYNCKRNGIVKYTGDWLGGRKHGSGEEVYRNLDKMANSVFSGEFAYGMKHGSGRLEQDNGAFFEGQWRNGMKTGLGKEEWV